MAPVPPCWKTDNVTNSKWVVRLPIPVALGRIECTQPACQVWIPIFEVIGIEQADTVRAVSPASQAWYRGPK